MLPWDPAGKISPKNPITDDVSIMEPSERLRPSNQTRLQLSNNLGMHNYVNGKT